MMAGSDSHRVVVTGVGVVSPIGIGQDAFWQNLIAGRSGIDLLTAFPSGGLPSKLAAEVRDFDPVEHIYHRKFLKVMSRDIQLGVASASMAMADAALPRGAIDPERLGVEFGAGHMSATPEELADAAKHLQQTADGVSFEGWAEDGLGEIAPLWLLKQLPNMPACHVAIEHDARGPNNTITSCESSALLALAEGMRAIERGAADAMIVGACSSYIHPLEIARLNLYENLSRGDDPRYACRPFDLNRDGTVAGEGAASFVLERYDHAIRRGAPIYCEILGVGAGCDGSDPANRASGLGLARSIDAALKRSNLTPRDLGHINAHGKGTRRDDVAEASAYYRSLGTIAESIPVTALKSYFGHFDAGAGAVELAGSLLAMRHGQLPMTLNYRTPDPLCRLNIVHDEPMKMSNGIALSVNRTRMGQSAAAVIRAV
ncbi:beta-ketoacyl-[acyl-carrier-protein] synthase family protein [Schlesneria sp. T3-172]|uniref:beta-ketoacyl-[acyl-carrier-protein] synthase family protein n=1 Tax=Schlesneria sphaerica TaxID=3373610 RepID=UPI0037C75BC1